VILKHLNFSYYLEI